MTRSEAARKAGLACAAKHGRDHMSKIGKAGFRALCRKFPGNSRSRALMHLNGKGSVVARYVPTIHTGYDAISRELHEEMGLEE